MTMVRLNGSHNTVDWHRQTIQTVRKEIPDTPILLDIPGRKLRLDIDGITPVHTGETLDLSLPAWIPDGVNIIFDDGKLMGTVIRDKVQFHQNGQLRPQIGMNIPSMPMQGPLLTPRDLEIIDLAQTENVDYIGLSFIESSALFTAIRQLTTIKCAAKIETWSAMQNLDDICQHADMIIVARGDLSVECGLFNVIKNQKQILQAAKAQGKVGVVGTGLLALYPPQQSTIADIHNAILDGADDLLVSSDVPDGQEVINAIKLLKTIVDLS
jgi:pyruvate kinase